MTRKSVCFRELAIAWCFEVLKPLVFANCHLKKNTEMS